MQTFNLVVSEAMQRGTNNRRELELTFDTDANLVAELLTVTDILDHFDHADLLDKIGVEEVKAHFGLVDSDV